MNSGNRYKDAATSPKLSLLIDACLYSKQSGAFRIGHAICEMLEPAFSPGGNEIPLSCTISAAETTLEEALPSRELPICAMS